ncbi:MAG: hypothetical protein KTR32_11715 [Granulosicoccus sp.]|nr:hypothetical protein [Granulosicoccus sp.]
MLTYRLLLGFLTPLILAHLFWRGWRDGGSLYLKQRLGFALPECHNCLWLHAASVGEVNTALPLIVELEHRDPSVPLLVTTNTPTGLQALHRSLSDNVQVCYLPLDFRFSIRRFFRRNSIRAGIILETEIWPNLYELATCKLAIVNGRLSHRSLRAAEGRAASIYQAALSRLSLVLTRNQSDADAFKRIGAKAGRVEVIGNLKFAVKENQKQHGDRPRLAPGKYCLLASTHNDEELQLAREWLTRKRDELLVIAPRHAERGTAIRHQLLPLTQSLALRSQNECIDSDVKIYIADTYGEMQNWYQHASAIFMGGSLISRGGHNMLEPAALAQSVITGKSTHNFSDEVSALMQDDAIGIAADSREIINQLTALLDKPEMATERGNRAKNMMDRHANVASRYADRLERWLES